MNKITVVILSFTILFQSFSFDLEDFNKIPTLVEHISCHLKNGDSFTDFIVMHYGSELANHEKDHKEHQELPFKHHHTDAHFHSVYIICSNNLEVLSTDFIGNQTNFTYKEPFTNPITSTIFQPPKVV
jgi:hypothetical protein